MDLTKSTQPVTVLGFEPRQFDLKPWMLNHHPMLFHKGDRLIDI